MLRYCISRVVATCTLTTFTICKQVECEYWVYLRCSVLVFSLGCVSIDCFCVHNCKLPGSWPVMRLFILDRYRLTMSSVCFPACLSPFLPAYLPACQSTCLPPWLSGCLPVCLPACLSVSLLVCFPACLSHCLSATQPICMHACLTAFPPFPSSPSFSELRKSPLLQRSENFHH